MAFRLEQLMTPNEEVIPHKAVFNGDGEFVAVVPQGAILHSELAERIDYLGIESGQDFHSRELGVWDDGMSMLIQVEFKQPVDFEARAALAYWVVNKIATAEVYVYLGVMAQHKSAIHGIERVFVLLPLRPLRFQEEHETALRELMDATMKLWGDVLLPQVRNLRHPDGDPTLLLESLKGIKPINRMFLQDECVQSAAVPTKTPWDLMVAFSAAVDRMMGNNLFRRYDIRSRANAPLRNELKGRN